MPRNGLGMPITSSSVGGAVLNVDDVLWESFGSDEIAINYAENYTNIVLHSQDATDAEAWTKTNTAIDSTLYEAPDNSTTANAIKSNSTGEKAYNISQGSLSVTAGKTYTLSVHVKKENLAFARVYFSDGASKTADFNLNTAAVTNTSNTIRTQVDSMDDDWYRCSITFIATSTTSSGSTQVFALSAAGDNTPNIAVSGIVLIYVWGFQLEENIEASPYIVTTTEARTATETLNDLSSIWDFDSADIMPEADPDSEGAWETLDNLVLNGTYEELGSEEFANGSFTGVADGTDVTTLTNWNTYGSPTSRNVVDNKLVIVATGSNQGAYYTLSSLSAGTYKLSVDVSGDVGAGAMYITGANSYNVATSVGNVEFYFVASGNTNIFFRAANNNAGTTSYTNISVKQVDPNDRWSLDSNWSIVNGKATSTGNGRMYQSISQFESASSIGTTVEVTFNIVERTSGGVVVNCYGGVSSEFNTVGTHSFITTTTNNLNLYFNNSGAGNLVGSIDNVTVREYAIQPQDV